MYRGSSGASSSSGSAHVSTSSAFPTHSEMNTSSKMTPHQYLYTQQQLYGGSSSGGLPSSDSSGDMLEFQHIMTNSNGALPNLLSAGVQNSSQQQQQHSQSYGYGQQYSGESSSSSSSGNYQRVNSLEVLCAVDDAQLAGRDQYNSLYTRNSSASSSFPWGLGGSGSRSDGGDPSSLSHINSSYYALNGGSVDSAGRGSFPPGSPEGRLPYSSSAEWPSMNNLVVAAETIEHLGSMNSLLGGGLLDSIASMGRMAAGDSIGTRVPDYFASSNVNTGAETHERQRHASIGSDRPDFVSHYRGSPLEKTAQPAIKIAAQQQQQEDGDVGYPIDEDEDLRSARSQRHNSFSSGPTNGCRSSADNLTLSNPCTTVDESQEVGAAPLQRCDSQNTPISSILLAGDMLFMPGAAGSDSAGRLAATVSSSPGTLPRIDSGDAHISDEQRSQSNGHSPFGDHGDGSLQRSLPQSAVRPAGLQTMPKTSSVDNFW